MLGAQIEVLGLVGDKWLPGEQYQFPDDLSELGPGESVTLDVPPTRVIRAKADVEPKPRDFRLKVELLPREDSFQHLVQNPLFTGPFPGSCDVYYVDFE